MPLVVVYAVGLFCTLDKTLVHLCLGTSLCNIALPGVVDVDFVFVFVGSDSAEVDIVQLRNAAVVVSHHLERIAAENHIVHNNLFQQVVECFTLAVHSGQASVVYHFVAQYIVFHCSRYAAELR